MWVAIRDKEYTIMKQPFRVGRWADENCVYFSEKLILFKDQERT